MAESTDTLKSKATLSILDLLGEGKIGGLIDGNKSVFFNDTVLQNPDGTYNFQGVVAFATNGDNTQPPVTNFGQNYVETPYNIGSQVKYGQPHTFAIVNPMADAVRVIVSIPALTQTDTSSGDISGYSVTYKFQMSINGGPYVDVPNGTKWEIGSLGMWGVESGYLTVTAPDGSRGIRASVKAHFESSSSATFAWAKFQPQEWNGSAWQNLGPIKSINVYRQAGANNSSSVSSETVTVQSTYNKVRFVKLTAPTGGQAVLDASTVEYSTVTGDITISGKTRSKYQRKHVLPIPRPADSVNVRMVRVSADSNSAYIANDTFLDSYYEIVTLNMVYPNSALYGFTIDSEQFNSIPSRAYLVNGLFIQVPSNYDATTRTYTGVWDGSLKKAVSDNPAWVMYDILTNDRYGLGEFLKANQVDKAMLYTIGRYCDELVDDGLGGYEPRFTLNTVIASREEAYKVISDIASVFRGMTYWSGGMACFTQDAPTDPSMIYGRANVIGGEFAYTGSARKDRHSVVHVTWNDPDENYKKKIEYVEDPDLISIYGVRKLDTLAFGCASRGQAARVGKWILYTEKYESDFISFKVGLDSAFITPGDIVKIQDPTRAGRRVAGRLLACSNTSATLDAGTVLTTGAVISIMMPDGSFVDRELIESDGTYSQVSWVSPLETLPENNAMWLIQEDDLVPILARVVSVSQASGTEFEITAIEHNPSKFAAIESDLALSNRRTSILDPTFVHTPANLTVTESQYQSSPGVIADKMLVSWFGDSSIYELTYQGLSGDAVSNPVKVRIENALTYEIPNVQLGEYRFSIVAINPLGRRSPTVTLYYMAVGKTTPPSDVPFFEAVDTDAGIELRWTQVADVDLKAYELRQCEYLKQNWADAEILARVPPTSNSYLVPPLQAGDYMWYITAVDLRERQSAYPRFAQITVETPNAPAISVSFANGSATLKWSSGKTSFPIEIYEVRVGPTFESASTIGRTSGDNFTVAATWGDAQTFWVVATDIAGNQGSPGSLAVTVSSPQMSAVTYALINDSYRLSWTSIEGTLPISEYEVRMGDENSTWSSATTLTDIAASTFEAKIDWLGIKKFFVAAIDITGNVSAAASTTINIGAPATPVMTSSIAGTALTLSWPTPTLGSLSLNDYELRVGTGSFSSATYLSELKSNLLVLPVTWVGARTFQIVARDAAGNLSPSSSLLVNIAAPGAPATTFSFSADTFSLNWSEPSATLPIVEYEVRFGGETATWASAASTAVRMKANFYSQLARWSGTRRWMVAAIDANGNMGAVTSTDVVIQAPSAPILTRTVIDNNVLLYWTESTGTLPIDTYELRRGNVYASASIMGKNSGGFTTVFETTSGVYTYWVTGIDSAGNYGTPASIAVTVDQPPDYVLKANNDSIFDGTLYNMTQDVDGTYIMPVNTVETFAQHFTARSWSTPDDQVNAGYPIYIQPALTSGYYEETINYGAIMPSTKITVTVTGQIVSGTPVKSTQISVRKTTSDPWVTYNSDSAFAGDFQYVKVRVTINGNGKDLYRVSGLNVRLDTKNRTDTGSGEAGATDSVTGVDAVINGYIKLNSNPLNENGVRVPDGDGTLVRFNNPFLDVSSIDMSVKAGSTARYGIYDFVDVPYAAGFKVQLFNAAGARVSGSFSWSAKGA